MARVVPSEDGYTITGGEPPGLRARPESVRRMYWGWVLQEGLRAKEADLAAGLDKDGLPLKPISAYTRAHRRSAMTPDGRGSPSAPPLTPAYQKSRTRSLLAGRAEVDGAEFWWKFDPFTGASWARILEYQRDRGRDVIGLSPRGVRRAVGRAMALYHRWERGESVPPPREIAVPQAPPIAAVGSTDLSNATLGINAPTSLGQWSGGMRIEDWHKHFRQPATVNIPARSGTNYNRILGHIWGTGGSPPTARPPAPVVPTAPTRPAPPTPRIPVAAPPPAGPRPKPTPKPAPQPAPHPPAIRPEDVRDVAGMVAYGQAQGVDTRAVTIDEMVRIYRYARGRAEQVPAFYDRTNRRILINSGSVLWTTPGYTAEEYLRQQGSWSIRHDLAGVVDHEVGHALHHKALGDRGYNGAGLRDDDWLGDPTDPAVVAEKERLARLVSEYAVTRPVEFVAEVYAGLRAGRKFSVGVMHLYRRHGGPTP